MLPKSVYRAILMETLKNVLQTLKWLKVTIIFDLASLNLIWDFHEYFPELLATTIYVQLI